MGIPAEWSDLPAKQGEIPAKQSEIPAKQNRKSTSIKGAVPTRGSPFLCKLILAGEH